MKSIVSKLRDIYAVVDEMQEAGDDAGMLAFSVCAACFWFAFCYVAGRYMEIIQVYRWPTMHGVTHYGIPMLVATCLIAKVFGFPRNKS